MLKDDIQALAESDIRLSPPKSKYMISSSNQVKKIGNHRSGHFCASSCHPYAGAMLIFSVSFQFYRSAHPKVAEYLRKILDRRVRLKELHFRFVAPRVFHIVNKQVAMAVGHGTRLKFRVRAATYR